MRVRFSVQTLRCLRARFLIMCPPRVRVGYRRIGTGLSAKRLKADIDGWLARSRAKSRKIADNASVGSSTPPRRSLTRLTVRGPSPGLNRHPSDEGEKRARGAAQVALLAIDCKHRHCCSQGRNVNELEATESEFFLDTALGQESDSKTGLDQPFLRGQAIDFQNLRIIEMGSSELTNDKMAQRVAAVPSHRKRHPMVFA
jgi:hypothetical protein